MDRKLNYDCGQQENRSPKKSSLVMRKLQVMKQPKLYPKRGGKDQTELPVARAAKGKTLFQIDRSGIRKEPAMDCIPEKSSLYIEGIIHIHAPICSRLMAAGSQEL